MIFRYYRHELGRFAIYDVEAPGEGYGQRVHLEAPRRRAEYLHVVAVCAGRGTVSGPHGVSWPLAPGMVDTDLPDYPHAGEYTYSSGPEGLRFFCASTIVKRQPFHRRVVSGFDPVGLAHGAVLLVVQGSALVADRVGRAPFIVDASAQAKTVVPMIVPFRGVLLW